MSETVRVLQLSDTHFRVPGSEPEGGHSYDTQAAFDAVLDHLGPSPVFDLAVVTGDIAAVTGRAPRSFGEFAREVAATGAWAAAMS